MKQKLPLFCILILASLLRLYSLGTNPPSLDWDEASLGYNAFSILKTGRDEYGNFLPFSIRSFNDYKPPAYVYLAVPSIALFGLTEFAVRLPSALMGILATALLYLLTKEIFFNYKNSNLLSLTSALLLAINPWHLQFSRGAFEANIALTFYLATLYSFLKWLNTSDKTQKLAICYLLLATFSSSVTLYSYHSARVVIPTMFITLLILYRRQIWKSKRQLVLPFLLGIFFSAPLILNTFRGTSSQRFAATSIFTNPGEFSRERERLERIADFKSQHSFPIDQLHKRSTVYLKLMARNYFEHFNFDFLFLRADGNPRHHVTGMGLLYLIEIPILFYGIYHLVGNQVTHKSIIWLLLFIGPLPAAFTASTPHAIRALLMLPTFPILTAFGSTKILDQLGQLNIRAIYKKNLLIVYGSLFILNVFYYLNLYYTVYPYTSSQDWQYGYKQLVQKISQVENQYDFIIVTTAYDQPHIFFAFYNRVDPYIYQTFAETAPQGFNKYTFKPINFSVDAKPRTLIAAELAKTPNDTEIIDTVNFLNGKPAFNLIEVK